MVLTQSPWVVGRTPGPPPAAPVRLQIENAKPAPTDQGVGPRTRGAALHSGGPSPLPGLFANSAAKGQVGPAPLLAPDVLGDLNDPRHLGPLLVLGQDIALFGAGEAALGAET